MGHLLQRKNQSMQLSKNSIIPQTEYDTIVQHFTTTPNKLYLSYVGNKIEIEIMPNSCIKYKCFDYNNKVLEYNLVLLNNKKFKYYLNDDYNNNIIKAIKITNDMSINKIIKLLDYSNYYKEDSHIKIIIKEHSTDNLYIEANIKPDVFDIDILSIDNYNFNMDIANDIIFDVDMFYYEYEEYL